MPNLAVVQAARARGGRGPGPHRTQGDARLAQLQQHAGNAALARMAKATRADIAREGNPLFGNILSDWGQRAAWGVSSQLSYLRGEGNAAATTKVQYGSLSSGGFGTFMLADPLVKKGDRGSSPTVENAMWKRLKRRLTPGGGATYYVRGHLLNDNVHGPGDRWENLTPLTGPANNQSTVSHLREVENPVKDAVARNERVVYRVQAVYGRNPLQWFRWLRGLFDFWAGGDEAIAQIRDTVYAENYVPTELWCKAWTYNDDGRLDPLLPETVIKQRQFAREGNPTDEYFVQTSAGVFGLEQRNVLARRVLPTLLLMAGAATAGYAAEAVRAWSVQQGTTPEETIVDNNFDPTRLIALWAPVIAAAGSAAEQWTNVNETPWAKKPPQ